MLENDIKIKREKSEEKIIVTRFSQVKNYFTAFIV